MKKYRDYVKQIFPLGFEDLVYYFDSTEYNGNYESYFQFCQENLLTQWKGLDFHPCFIYFRKDKELQALARRLPTGEGIIEINNGLFEKLNDIFYQNREFISSLPGVSQLEEQKLMDAPMYYLMFQELMLFLYYHEFGHIIQFSKISMMITERNVASKGFDNSLLLHVMEMDSDEIASNYTIHHIMATWEKAPIEHRSYEFLETLITMSVAAIFLLFDLLGGEEGIKLPIYYHERTHPHSAIRIIAISASFLEILKQQYGISELSADDVLRRTFRILAEILQQSRFMEKFPEHLRDEEENINKYLRVVLAERDKYPWLAGNQIDALFRAKRNESFLSKS